MAGGKRTARQAARAGRALEAEAREAHRRQAEANGAFNARTVSLPAPWPPGPQRRVARAQRGADGTLAPPGAQVALLAGGLDLLTQLLARGLADGELTAEDLCSLEASAGRKGEGACGLGAELPG